MGLLFKYTLTDAWHFPLSEFAIFDSEPGYVFYWVQGKDKFDLPMDQKSIDLADETIAKIKELIMDLDVTEIEDLEHVIVMDGYIHEFCYIVDGRKTECTGYNISYCKEQPKLYPNAMVLIRLLQKLKDILVPLGVDNKCFSLSRR